jgi:hypothetical protein
MVVKGKLDVGANSLQTRKYCSFTLSGSRAHCTPVSGVYYGTNKTKINSVA